MARKSRLEHKPTQCERVLDYIRQFGSISSFQAYADLGVTQLGARIFELKREGYVFNTCNAHKQNRFGEKVTYKIYSLMLDHKFRCKDRVVVTANTERKPELAMIGCKGTVVALVFRDAVVKFDDGIKVHILEDDLELLQEEKKNVTEN